VSEPWKIAVGAIAVGLIVLSSCGVYLILRFGTYHATSESMAPTIRTHQVFVVDRFAYRGEQPRRDDIVLFSPPMPLGNPLFKRVVAVPGDRFAIRGGRTFINGKAVDEPYAPYPANYDLAVRGYDMWVDGVRLDHAIAMIPPRAQWTAPDTVPQGCYVVLGDDRPNSQDSHWFGFFCPGQPVPNQPNVHQELVGRALVPSR
jgi:signal peptidase I